MEDEKLIRFSEIQLKKLVLHRVGNKNEEEGIHAAKKLFKLNDELRGILLNYFLNSFKLEETYRFNHDTDLSMNEVYSYCSYIFEDSTQFYDQSINILKHLYEKSNHSKIKSGELYVAYFEDCVIEDELVNAVGIFKAETKDTYLKLQLDEDEDYGLAYEEGTNITKLDKGCIIFNIHAEDGYRAVTVDLKSSEAKYWRDDFLVATQMQDDAFHTKNYISMCKKFCKEVYKEEDKNDQVEFLNKSVDYFNTKQEFDFEEFKEEIFEDIKEADKFSDFKKSYQEKQGIAEEESFFISQPALKKAKRSIRNNIQLDTDIDIKINSANAQSEGNIERGYDDERGMHYYKIYFNKEK